MKENFERPVDTEKIAKAHEVIIGPESPTLTDFHEFLGKVFNPNEIEPLDVFQRELRNEKPGVRYILTALRDPDNADRLVSAAYGSVQDGVLAVRFTLTEAGEARSYRGTGLSQIADQALIKEAEAYSLQEGTELKALIGEAVDLSEGYWNRQEIEPGNGMKRMYLPRGEEMHYELPPLSWNPDGTPASDGIPEHLQLALKGSTENVSVAELSDILRSWWGEWYIRPREQFDSGDAWQKHQDTVWKVLDDKILSPLSEVDKLTFKTKAERELEQK